MIGIYVDDILLASKTSKQIKSALAEWFDVKDLGELNYFLGIKIVQNHKAGTSGLDRSHEKVQDGELTLINPRRSWLEVDER